MENEHQPASKPRIEKRLLHFGQHVTLALAAVAYFNDGTLEITREDGSVEHVPLLKTQRDEDGRVIVQFPMAIIRQIIDLAMEVRLYEVQEAGNIDPEKVNMVVHLQPKQQSKILLANQYTKIQQATQAALLKQQ